MLQEFINRQFYHLLLFTLILGVMFYDALHLTFADEICSVLLFVLYLYYVFHTKDWNFNKLFLITLGVFIFYLFYSLLFGVNTRSAIITDFIIQLKPYIAFFCVYSIKPQLNNRQKSIIKYCCIGFSIYLFIVGVLGMVNINVIYATFGHTSRFATAASILALLYLYCSNYTLKEKIIFIILLSVGLFSTRSKFYGFLVICSFLVFYVNESFELKFNKKNTFLLIILIAGVAFVAKDKFAFYFIQGGFGDGRGEQDLYARMALYYFSLSILLDYLPFGPGFGSYATYASQIYYSPIYYKYNMQSMHGLSKSFPDFIADTYYPALSQFGIVGVTLFFAFWIHLTIQAFKYLKIYLLKESVIALLIIAFFMIECTTDSTITHNRGLFMMMLLGLVLSNAQLKSSEKQNEDTDSK